MISKNKPLFSLYLPLLGGILLLALQFLWIYDSYKLSYKEFIINTEEAFKEARQKEQTYRIPVGEIVNPGAVTIQSCENEDILIIRKCPTPDTIVYNNLSGRSLETFINQAFSELREHILPLNIYCLADLFAGALHDKDIPVSFVIERVNKTTGEVLETSLPSGDKPSEIKASHTFVVDISDTEAFRVNLLFSAAIILRQTNGVLIGTSCLLVIALLCFYFLLYFKRRPHLPGKAPLSQTAAPVSFPEQNQLFRLGEFLFDPDKNELSGFGESVQLNKKENAILSALCAQMGNVVERNALLENNWGESGAIYSRSLDTYITSLRKYLRKDPAVQIVTVKGLGYKLVVQ